METYLIVFVLGFLTTYRLSSAITSEEGPFNLFEIIRNAFIKRNPNGDWLSRGIRCINCVSFWIGPIVTAVGLLTFIGTVSPVLVFLIGWSISGAIKILVSNGILRV